MLRPRARDEGRADEHIGVFEALLEPTLARNDILDAYSPTVTYSANGRTDPFYRTTTSRCALEPAPPRWRHVCVCESSPLIRISPVLASA